MYLVTRFLYFGHSDSTFRVENVLELNSPFGSASTLLPCGICSLTSPVFKLLFVSTSLRSSILLLGSSCLVSSTSLVYIFPSLYT